MKKGFAVFAALLISQLATAESWMHYSGGDVIPGPASSVTLQHANGTITTLPVSTQAGINPVPPGQDVYIITNAPLDYELEDLYENDSGKPIRGYCWTSGNMKFCYVFNTSQNLIDFMYVKYNADENGNFDTSLDNAKVISSGTATVNP